MRRKKVGLLLTLGVVLAVACCIGYTRFIEKKIYEESTSHLEEIYTQVNTSFTSLVSKNWNLLKDWEYYIHDAVKNEEPALTDFIQQAKDQWNITYFYFLDRRAYRRDIADGLKPDISKPGTEVRSFFS